MLRRRCCLAWMAIGGAGVARAAPSAAEQQMIDRLIERVAAMNDARFVRNFKEYKAADAATFMREKLRLMGQGVNTCDEFIDRIATRSSTTGLAYKIRFADGREMPSGEFLHAELARLRAAQASAR